MFPKRSLPHKRFLTWLKIVSSPPLSNWVRKVWKLTCVPLDFQTAFAILIGLAPQSSSVVYCVHPVSWSEGIHFNTSIPFCFVKNIAEILEFPGLNCDRYVELTTIPKRITNQPSIEMRMLWRWKTTYTLLKKPTIALKALFLQFLFTVHFSFLLRTSGFYYALQDVTKHFQFFVLHTYFLLGTSGLFLDILLKWVVKIVKLPPN